MYCRKCGAIVESDAAFCGNCGTKVLRESEATENNLLESLKDPDGISQSHEVKQFNPFADTKMLSFLALIITAVGVVGYYSTRCNASGCYSKAEYGNYCISHVCLSGNCTRQAAYGSNYCYLHQNETVAENDAMADAENDLKFSNIVVETNSYYTICTGKITNNGTRTYKFVEIKGAFQDSAGVVIDTDWTYAVGSEGLESGESTTFRMSVDKDYSIEKCSVSILDCD